MVSPPEAIVALARVTLESVKHSLAGAKLVISEACGGLKSTRCGVFDGIPLRLCSGQLWQHCQFHLQQNTLAYVPRQSITIEIVIDIHPTLNALTYNATEALLAAMGTKHEKQASPGGTVNSQNSSVVKYTATRAVILNIEGERPQDGD